MRFRSRYRHHWHPDAEILPPLRAERDLTTRSLARTSYRVLSRPEDFTRPYGRSFKYLKSFAAAAASLNATRRISQEDERHFHPAKKFRPAKTTQGRNASVSPRLKKAKIYRPGDPGFRSSRRSKRISLATAMRHFVNPTSVIPCIQRHVRREVIMALYGGGASHSRKRRNRNSDIGC